MNQFSQFLMDEDFSSVNKKSYIATGKRFGRRLDELEAKQSEEYDKMPESDDILARLDRLFSGKIGSQYSEDRLSEIYEDGAKRYKKRTPPGFEDQEKKAARQDNSEYGDLIMWYQIIDEAKQRQKPVILVTEDLKSDWWKIINGRTIGPHPMLLAEFREKVGQRIWIYRSSRFVDFAAGHLKIASIDQESIRRELESPITSGEIVGGEDSVQIQEPIDIASSETKT